MQTRNKLTSHDKLKSSSPWGIDDNKKSRFAKRFLCKSLFWIASYGTLLSKSSEKFSVLDWIAVYATIIWAWFQQNWHNVFLKQNRSFHFLTKSFRLARKFAAIHLSSVSGGLNSQFEEQAYATNRGWIGELSIFLDQWRDAILRYMSYISFLGKLQLKAWNDQRTQSQIC